MAAVDTECEVAKVWFTEDGGNDRRQDVGYERLNKSCKRSTDDDCDREVNHVASHYELFEALQHVSNSSPGGPGPGANRAYANYLGSRSSARVAAPWWGGSASRGCLCPAASHHHLLSTARSVRPVVSSASRSAMSAAESVKSKI